MDVGGINKRLFSNCGEATFPFVTPNKEVWFVRIKTRYKLEIEIFNADQTSGAAYEFLINREKFDLGNIKRYTQKSTLKEKELVFDLTDPEWVKLEFLGTVWSIRLGYFERLLL